MKPKRPRFVYEKHRFQGVLEIFFSGKAMTSMAPGALYRHLVEFSITTLGFCHFFPIEKTLTPGVCNFLKREKIISNSARIGLYEKIWSSKGPEFSEKNQD